MKYVTYQIQNTKKNRFTFTTVCYPLAMFDYVSSQIQTLRGQLYTNLL